MLCISVSGIKHSGLSHHHTNTSTPEKDGSWQLLAVVIGDFSLKSEETQTLSAEEIGRLDINRPQLVRSSMEGVMLVLLSRYRVLQR